MEKDVVTSPVAGEVVHISIKQGQQVQCGDHLVSVTDEKSGEVHQIKSLKDGTILEVRKAVGDKIVPRRTICVIGSPCAHLRDFGGVCTSCGTVVTTSEGRETVVKSHRDRFLREHVSVALESSKEHKEKLIASKKLILILDLDHTVIHATCERDIGNGGVIPAARTKFTILNENIHEFEAGGVTYWLKVRPGAKEFIEKVSEMYEIHVYTAAERVYADHVVSIIDPDNKYIGERVLTRTEGPDLHRKFVDRLFPFSAELVVVVDDSIKAWIHDKGQFHLYLIPRFFFFLRDPDADAKPSEIKAEQEEEKSNEEEEEEEESGDEEEEEEDEENSNEENTPEREDTIEVIEGIPQYKWINPKSWRDEELRFCFKALKGIHDEYYQQNIDSPLSVNHMLTKVREKVLNNVHILFSSIVPSNITTSPFWYIATAFGARCYEKKCDKITHVICAHKNTDKYNWGLANKKHVVHISWLVQTVRRWEKPPENLYTLDIMGNCPKEHLKVIRSEFEDALHCYPVVAKEVTKADLTDLFDSEESDDSDDSDSSDGSPPLKKQKLE